MTSQTQSTMIRSSQAATKSYQTSGTTFVLPEELPRPINLVLTGPRSAGKTSLLNRIASESLERGFVVSRVDLNESDASPLALFYKIYDAIVFAAVRDGAFAGFSGEVYSRYRDTMDGGNTESPQELLFPRHYAAAVNAGRTLSEPALKNDLQVISKELGKPCVLLFDECDVLGKSRIELEMIRNVFMNTPGYMLVFAGTPNLFPVMEDVFSPIVRQFKKIPVEHFAEAKDTVECIEKPLMRLGIKPDEVLMPYSSSLQSEVHRLSAGRPYEVQLLCHYMFKRVEDGRARNMAINLDVLEDVRRELETQERGSERPIIAALQELTGADLSLLRALTRFRGTLEQLWATSQTFDEGAPEKEVLELGLKRFETLGLLSVTTHGEVRFNGDQFDEIYAKYYAAANEATLQISTSSSNYHLGLQLRRVLIHSEVATLLYRLDPRSHETKSKLDEALRALTVDDWPTSASLPDMVDELYGPVLAAADRGSIKLANVQLTLAGSSAGHWIAVDSESDTSLLSEPFLSEVAARVEALGGSLTAEFFDHPVPPAEFVMERAKGSGAPNQLENFSDVHRDRGFDLHGTKDYVAALVEFTRAVDFLPSKADHWTSCSHMNLLLGDAEQAENLAEEARRRALFDFDLVDDAVLEPYAFATYDLAVARILQGDRSSIGAILGEVTDLVPYLEDVDGFLAIPEVSPDGSVTLQLAEGVTLSHGALALRAFELAP